MDIALARTFLAVFETGNFNRAAELINVTQSTVSTRIQNLELQLGQTLFQRSRAGTEPTASGRRFQVHAANLVRVWQHARQELALPETIEEVLAIGGQFSLWDDLLDAWLPWMRKNLPEVAIRAEVGFPNDLTQRLMAGDLDIGVMYAPQSRAGLVIDKLLDDRLVAVGTEPDGGGPGSPEYVYVDWGTEFRAEHGQAFPETQLPRLRVSHGILALPYILSQGGSCYLPMRSVASFLDKGQLHLVKKAPPFRRSAFIVYPEERADNPRFVTAVQGLKQMTRNRLRMKKSSGSRTGSST